MNKSHFNTFLKSSYDERQVIISFIPRHSSQRLQHTRCIFHLRRCLFFSLEAIKIFSIEWDELLLTQRGEIRRRKVDNLGLFQMKFYDFVNCENCRRESN